MAALRLFFFLATAGAILWFVWTAYAVHAPARYNITTPLDLTLEPSFVTEWKRRTADAETCFTALAAAGVAFTRLPDAVRDEGCELRDVATLDRSAITWGGGVTLTCQMLAGLYLWERWDLAPAAAEHFGSDVVRIRHYGSYACRNINNRETGRRSEHARANAVDVAGFVFADGREARVLSGWEAGGEEEAFLKAVHQGACRRFGTVLGPDYNPAHHDHFHLDFGRFSLCR